MKILSKLTVLALVAASVCALPRTSDAATLFPPDTWPNADWSVRTYGTPVVGTASLKGHTWLTIARDTSNSGSAQVIYNGGSVNGSGVPVVDPSNQLGDIKGSVIVGSSNWGDSLGVILRAEGPNFSSVAASKNAYYLAMTSTGLNLFWNVGDSLIGDASVVRLAQGLYSSALTTLSASNNGQYLIDFSVVGLQFDASVWLLDSEGNKSGSALASISYLDEREVARLDGYFGLRGGRFGGNRTAYFRDLQVDAIPEPSMGALLLLGLGGGAIGRWVFCNKKG